MFKDTRRFQRLALNTTIKFKQYRDYEKRIYYEDKEIDAVALDISESGIGIQTRCFMPAKTYLQIWISLSSLNQEGQIVFSGPMRILGKVRWVIPWDDNTFRIGISFLEIQEEDKNTLKNFINSHIGNKEKIIRQRDVSSGTVLREKKGPQQI